MSCYRAEELAIIDGQRTDIDVADPACLLQDRIEYWCQVTEGRVDYPHHLGGGSLLLQCLALLGEKPCVLHRDHRLIREVLTSSICRSVNGSTRWRARTITPIGSPSRISGTPSEVRCLPSVIAPSP